jgi:hypothetical protein
MAKIGSESRQVPLHILASMIEVLKDPNGEIARRRLFTALVTANRIPDALAAGNCDHNRAIAPVTKGAAALVPENVCGLPFVPRLVMSMPGAIRPRPPIDFPKFDALRGEP